MRQGLSFLVYSLTYWFYSEEIAEESVEEEDESFLQKLFEEYE